MGTGERGPRSVRRVRGPGPQGKGRWPGRHALLAVLWGLLSVSGCDGGSDSSPSARVPRLLSSTYFDVNGNGRVDGEDRVVLAFDSEVSVAGTVAADLVARVEPAGSFGPSAIVVPTWLPREVEIRDLDGANLQPNGVFGVDPTASGLDLVAGQPGIVDPAGRAARSAGEPVDVAGLLHPRVTAALYVDGNANCVADSADTVEVTFSCPITLNSTVPAEIFWLPVAADSLGTTASIQSPTTGVTTVIVSLGDDAILNDLGSFDPAIRYGGSPSGIDVQPVSGRIVDAAFPEVTAFPNHPFGRDLDGPGVLCAPVPLSAVFVDVDVNGIPGRPDTLTITFDRPVVVTVTPLASEVLDLVPGGTFGAGATLAPGGPPGTVVVVLEPGAAILPNGVHGQDPGSTGVNLKPSQTDLTGISGTPVQPLPSALDVAGEVNPRVTEVVFTDANASCTVDAGDTLGVTFTTRVSFLTADPTLAFQLPISGDSLGVGASLQGGTPIDVLVATVVLGTGPALRVGGVFDPSVTTPGSSSGLDIAATVGIIVDAAFPAVSGLPASPPGKDLEVGAGGCTPALQAVSYVDANDNGILDPPDFIAVTFDRSVSLIGTPPASSVFSLDPPGTFGPSSTVGPGSIASEVRIAIQGFASFEPNGVYGVDAGSTGLNLLPGQQAIEDLLGTPVPPNPTPLDISGERNPRVRTVTYDDLDGDCSVGIGDAVIVEFTDPVSFSTSDPAQAFQLPVSGDAFGSGAVFASGTPTNVATITVLLGISPTLTPPGTFDPGTLAPGSPSGLDVDPTPGRIVLAAYPSVSAMPRVPVGVEVDDASSTDWVSTGDELVGVRFGWGIANAGDVDGDGYEEILVGAPWSDDFMTNAGKAFLFRGRACGADPASSWTVVGEGSGDLLGYSVACAGDVNNDGFADVIIGAAEATTQDLSAGKAYLYLGGPSGLSPTPDWTSSGDDVFSAKFGFSVSTAGDVNNDGFDDVIVGARHHPATSLDSGKAYIYLGGSSGLSTSPVWSSIGDDQGTAFYGHVVSSAGDVNNDGFSDVLVGAPSFNQLTNDVGKAYLYLGNASGVDALPVWTSTGDDQDLSRYAEALACAGDVDNDGYDDIIVGAHWYDTPSFEMEAGKVYLYLGGPGGPASTPSWTSTGDSQPRASFGFAVASAGDVNNDGFADLIIGAYRQDTTIADVGKAFVYLGGSSGPSSSPFWTSSGEEETDCWFGAHVCSIGDRNGDGKDDVIVSAPNFTTPTTNEVGKAYLFFDLP